MAKGICKKCQQLFDHWSEVLDLASSFWPRDLEYTHHSTPQLLQASADSGCALCGLFFAQLKSGNVLNDWADQIGEIDQSEDGSVFITAHDWPEESAGKDDTWLITLSFRYDEWEHDTDVWLTPSTENYRHSGNISEDHSCSNSDKDLSFISSIQLAKYWLKECGTCHENCKTSLPKKNEVDFPSRLISIAGDRVRLCDEGEILGRPLYLTLSHCWGNLHLFKLLKENHDALRKEILQDKLCKTFRDAIWVTRELGFHYLWIDSLCIVQNDEEDWSRECPKMCGIYEGSALNLAASSAVDGSVGLFFERSDQDLTLAKKIEVEIKLEGQTRSYNCFDTALFDRCVSDTPLSFRGWVLQERFLARRNLYFAITQLFWECKSYTACETFPEGLPHSFHGQDGYLQDIPLSRLWREAVSIYAKCNLTFSKDKLPAISGIARWIQRQTSDEYVAGLWRRDLELQLCWRSLPLKQRPGSYLTLKEFRAPSWSWACLDGRSIGIPSPANRSNPMKTLCHVVDVDIHHRSNDKFEVVSRGKLRLRCSALLKSLQMINVKDQVLYWDLPINEQENFYYLLVSELTSDDGSTWHMGLLLAASDSNVKGEFRRLGSFSTGRWEGGYKAFKDTADSDLEVDGSLYENTTGDDTDAKMYYISLI